MKSHETKAQLTITEILLPENLVPIDPTTIKSDMEVHP